MADRQDNDRRNEFIDAAEKLFRENGIVDTTISSIVKEVYVAKGLFYYYFNSKEDVFDAVSEKYREIYDDADGSRWQDKLNSMRRDLYAENKDEINEQKREAYAERKERTEEA